MTLTFLSPFLSLFSKRKTPAKPASGGAASPPGSRGAIPDGKLTAGSGAQPHDGGAAPPSFRDKLTVGAGLNEARRRALAMAEKFAALADAETGRAILGVTEQLHRQVCCIAFAGQVKSGKSSLINVMAERLNFLPADINPCTAVITRLNFAVPGKPQTGALFTFFSGEEWRRLSLRGRTRELSDQLFPDFDWGIFKSQLQAMEQRARQKHGAALDGLLGTAHSFEDIEANLLIRYIGVEFPEAESAEELAEGEFSDITKSADIFLDPGVFQFPAVLIDTPGVNDPSLVRDEITRQNLGEADICVVAVTARQPLSEADIGLLRTLKGLGKNRLIIFINKIDEVGGSEEIVKAIKQRVASTLEQEFPSASIPIIAGSAAFARKALAEDGAADEAEAAALFAQSGVVLLANAISEMMRNSPAGGVIDEAASLIEGASRNLITWMEIKADLLGRIPAGAGQVEQDLAAITRLRNALAAGFDAFPAKLDAIHSKQVSRIRQKLSAAVEAFIPPALGAFPDGDAAAQASQLGAKLRLQLETVFLEAIADVRDALGGERNALKAELSSLLNAGGLAGKPEIVMGQLPAFAPSLAALSEPAAPHNADGKAGLQPQLIADFTPVVEALCSEAGRVFKDAACAFTAQAKALTLGPAGMVIAEVSQALEAHGR